LGALGIAVLGLTISSMRLQDAFAHASYDHSNPSDKQVLATGPSQLTITFVSSIVPSPGTFAFVSNGDTDVSAGPSAVSPSDPDTLIVPLQANLPNGKYDVFWKSTDADDGGVTFGHFSFFVGNATASDLAATTPAVAIAVPDDATQNALNPVGTSVVQGPESGDPKPPMGPSMP